MLKLQRFDKAEWRDFAGAKFLIRPATPRAYLELREKAKRGMTKVDGQVLPDYDENAFAWSIFDYVLQDWQELEVEGTTERHEIKETVFDNAAIRDFILAEANQMFQDRQASYEGELKNSESSQGGQ